MNPWLESYLCLAKTPSQRQLISQAAWRQIEELAPLLPAFSRSILECRLGSDAPQVDFSIYLQRQKLATDQAIYHHPIWCRVQNFYQHWLNPASPLHSIYEGGLEFDLEGNLPDVPIPSFFFSLFKAPLAEVNLKKDEKNPVIQEQTLENAPEILAEVWQVVNGETIPPTLQKNLENCFDLMPKNTYINLIGMMFSRANQATRLELGGFTIHQVLPYLEKIGWQGESERLAEMIAIPPVEFSSCRLAFDVGEQIYPRVGLLYHLPNPKKQEPQWQKFLEILIKHQLCTPEKKEALEHWQGYTQTHGNSAAFPHLLANIAALKDNRILTVIERLFRTVKMVYQPGKPFEAKAYLLYSHLDILVPKSELEKI